MERCAVTDVLMPESISWILENVGDNILPNKFAFALQWRPPHISDHYISAEGYPKSAIIDAFWDTTVVI
jgi:hypothetical protein